MSNYRIGCTIRHVHNPFNFHCTIARDFVATRNLRVSVVNLDALKART